MKLKSDRYKAARPRLHNAGVYCRNNGVKKKCHTFSCIRDKIKQTKRKGHSDLGVRVLMFFLKYVFTMISLSLSVSVCLPLSKGEKAYHGETLLPPVINWREMVWGGGCLHQLYLKMDQCLH